MLSESIFTREHYLDFSEHWTLKNARGKKNKLCNLTQITRSSRLCSINFSPGNLPRSIFFMSQLLRAEYANMERFLQDLPEYSDWYDTLRWLVLIYLTFINWVEKYVADFRLLVRVRSSYNGKKCNKGKLVTVRNGNSSFERSCHCVDGDTLRGD